MLKGQEQSAITLILRHLLPHHPPQNPRPSISVRLCILEQTFSGYDSDESYFDL